MNQLAIANYGRGWVFVSGPTFRAHTMGTGEVTIVTRCHSGIFQGSFVTVIGF